MAKITKCISELITTKVEMESKDGDISSAESKERVQLLTHKILGMEEELRALHQEEIRNGSINEGNIKYNVENYLTKEYNSGLDAMDLQKRRQVYIRALRTVELNNRAYDIAGQLEPETATRLTELRKEYASEPNENAKAGISLKIETELSDLHKRFPEAMSAIFVGTEKNIEGGKSSLDANINALRREYFGGLLNDLDDAGLEDVFFSESISRDLAKELANLTVRDKKTGKIKINPESATTSKEARTLAEIVYKYQNNMLRRLNRAGNNIRQMPGYITRQSHTAANMKRVGKEKWVDFLLDGDLLNIDKTFFGRVSMTAEDIRTELGTVYDNIVVGNYRYGDFKTRAPHRELHFKNSDSFMDYNDKFGSGSLVASIEASFRKGSREIGLVEMMGPEPREVLDDFFELMFEYSSDPGVAKKWDDGVRRKIEGQFREFDGTTSTPADNMLSGIARRVRAWMNVTKLGSATLSAMADIPILSSELRHQGDSLLNGYSGAFANLAKGRGKGVRKRVAREVGAGFEGMLGQLLARFSPIDQMPRWMNKAQQKFFKYSGLEWWTDAHKTGVANMMAFRLGEMRDLPFDKIDKDINRLLRNYGMDETKWDLIRKNAAEVGKMEDGRIYITPDNIRYISDEDILAALPAERAKDPRGLKNAIDDYRDKLGTGLRAYFVDRIDYGVPTPGARERAITHGGTAPGTPMGEAMRFFWQFKSFPLTVWNRVLKREWQGKGSPDIGGLAHIVIGTTVMGYAAMSAKDIAKGRKPRDFTEKPGAVFMGALTQGGGLGIIGDFLFQGHTRYGQSKLESFMGPTYGTASQLIRLTLEDGVSFAKGDKTPESYGASWLNLARQNVPMINMWYSKWAIEYLMLYAIQEELNPGYFNRMNRNLKKNMATESFLEPGLGLY